VESGLGRLAGGAGPIALGGDGRDQLGAGHGLAGLGQQLSSRIETAHLLLALGLWQSACSGFALFNLDELKAKAEAARMCHAGLRAESTGLRGAFGIVRATLTSQYAFCFEEVGSLIAYVGKSARLVCPPLRQAAEPMAFFDEAPRLNSLVLCVSGFVEAGTPPSRLSN
jgi:hypothetical protein